MDSANRAPAELEPRENIFLGVIGAVLFSLAGALCYFLLNRVGYIAAFSAAFGAYCASFGYGLFSGKKRTKAGTITVIIVTLIVMFLAAIFCLAFDLYKYIRDYYQNYHLTDAIVDTVHRLFDSSYTITYGVHEFTVETSAIIGTMVGNVIFTLLGVGGYINMDPNKRRAAQQAAQGRPSPLSPVDPSATQTDQPQTPPTENDSPEEE